MFCMIICFCYLCMINKVNILQYSHIVVILTRQLDDYLIFLCRAQLVVCMFWSRIFQRTATNPQRGGLQPLTSLPGLSQ